MMLSRFPVPFPDTKNTSKIETSYDVDRMMDFAILILSQSSVLLFSARSATLLLSRQNFIRCESLSLLSLVKEDQCCESLSLLSLVREDRRFYCRGKISYAVRVSLC